jgi:hypothetical protein
MERQEMQSESKFLGCFVSWPATNWDDEVSVVDAAHDKARIFRTFVWGPGGIFDFLESIRSSDYSEEISLILFQFFLNPSKHEVETRKEIGSYRKSEKSISISVFVNDASFFDVGENEKMVFMKEIILQKLKALGVAARKRKLELNIEKLMKDLEEPVEKWRA